MANLKPTTLILTLAPEPQDGRDLYREHKLTCACCVAAPPRQDALFDRGARYPG